MSNNQSLCYSKNQCLERGSSMLILSRPMVLLSVLLLQSAAFAQTPLQELYQHFHANPELSFQERDTATRFAAELSAAGFEVTQRVGGDIRKKLAMDGAVLNEQVDAYGVVGVLRNGSGPTLMIRSDMDGLPVAEQSPFSFASRVKAQELTGQDVSVMHACGHDVHMVSVLGAARALSKSRDQWRGTLVIIGQPAEERGAGARMMLEDGLYERFPRPDYNLALHVTPGMPAGQVGYISGWMMANVDSVDITVHGIGGHGAYPESGKDPIVLSAKIIMDLQTLVSREISPLKPAVVTVGSMHSGSKHNVISNRADLQLTVRSYSDEVRDKLLAGIERVAINQARAAGLPEDKLPEVRVKAEYTPALWNDPEFTQRAAAVLSKSLGADKVVPVEKVMGGEDFARYSRVEPKIPSLLLRLGAMSQDRYDAAQQGEYQLPSLHSPLFYPDPELTIATGVKSLHAVAIDILQ
jgi:hippurate hydrolase